MQVIKSKDYTADQPWGAKTIASMNGITVRLHWADRPYKWHVNDGEEIFVVLDGRVEMRYRKESEEHSVMMNAGDIFHASVGTEHIACPVGEARVLVVEHEGSV